MSFISQHWNEIAPILALVLALVAKVPFIQHSTLAETGVNIVAFVIKHFFSADPSNDGSQNGIDPGPQPTAKVQAQDLNPKK